MLDDITKTVQNIQWFRAFMMCQLSTWQGIYTPSHIYLTQSQMFKCQQRDKKIFFERNKRKNEHQQQCLKRNEIHCHSVSVKSIQQTKEKKLVQFYSYFFSVVFFCSLCCRLFVCLNGFSWRNCQSIQICCCLTTFVALRFSSIVVVSSQRFAIICTVRTKKAFFHAFIVVAQRNRTCVSTSAIICLLMFNDNGIIMLMNNVMIIISVFSIGITVATTFRTKQKIIIWKELFFLSPCVYNNFKLHCKVSQTRRLWASCTSFLLFADAWAPPLPPHLILASSWMTRYMYVLSTFVLWWHLNQAIQLTNGEERKDCAAC